MRPGPLIDRPGFAPLRRLGIVVLCAVLAAALASCAAWDHDRDGGAGAGVQAEAAAGPGDGPGSGRQASPPALADQATADARPDKPAQDRRPKDEPGPARAGQILERTAALAERFGGQVRFLEHPDRDLAAVLVLPQQLVEGGTPLIVSLHGFGANSADHAEFAPLHERVDADGFALLLPNGQPDTDGNRFWNPTDRCCDGGKSGSDDVAYLTQIVAAAQGIAEFGPVYFFGYSNGGFMSYHMACKGLPGLRAVASVAGTSYVKDSSCEGAPAVSVLHLHGTQDSVIRFDGDESERSRTDDEEPAFYAGAREMVARWSQRAGCGWPEESRPYASLDLDRLVPGAETRAYRPGTACARGIEIELWVAEGSGHAMYFGDTFVDALLDWLLPQR